MKINQGDFFKNSVERAISRERLPAIIKVSHSSFQEIERDVAIARYEFFSVCVRYAFYCVGCIAALYNSRLKSQSQERVAKINLEKAQIEERTARAMQRMAQEDRIRIEAAIEALERFEG